MLTAAEMKYMNAPIWRGTACIGYQRPFLRSDVVEMLLELVHPVNLRLDFGPPSPAILEWKAVQIGLVAKASQCYEVRRCGQFN